MTPYFSVLADPAARLLRMTLSGFFEEADVRCFAAARDIQHARLPAHPDGHDTLVDIREMHIQSREVVALFGQMLAERRYRSRRLAFVVQASLARMQLERAAAGRGRFFRDPEEAEAWLAGGEDSAPAAPSAWAPTTGPVQPFSTRARA